jgi:hypothetical protein
MLSDMQKSQFEQVGVVRLTGVFSEATAQHMYQQVWDLLAEKYGIYPGEPATWTIMQPTGFQALTQAGAFKPIVSWPLANALAQILGGHAWGKPEHWGSPLVTFPGHAAEWQVPNRQSDASLGFPRSLSKLRDNTEDHGQPFSVSD